MLKKLFIFSQILILLFLKIIIIMNTELTEDEAYYFLWSKKLSLSYFDHPPMVAYFIKVGTKIMGENELGVRFPAFFTGILFLFFIYMIFREIKKENSLIAVYITSLILLFSVGAIVITPDTPLALFLILTFYFILKSKHKNYFIYLAGIFYGLSLLSKYQAILILPAILFFFYKNKKLLSKEFFLFLILSILFFSPCLIWNIKNDFLSFKFQLYHGYGAKEVKLFNILIFLRDSLLVLSFPLSILIYFYAIKGVIKEKISFLTLAFSFPFIFFITSSIKTRPEANWALPAYIFMIVLACKYVKENRVFYITGFITFLLLIFVHLHTITPLIKLKKDPTYRMKGWEKLADDFEWFSQRYGIKNYAANNYQIASELSFYLKEKPFVYSLNINSRQNQFTLWQKNKKIPDTLFYAGKINEGFKKIFKK